MIIEYYFMLDNEFTGKISEKICLLDVKLKKKKKSN